MQIVRLIFALIYFQIKLLTFSKLKVFPETPRYIVMQLAFQSNSQRWQIGIAIVLNLDLLKIQFIRLVFTLIYFKTFGILQTWIIPENPGYIILQFAFQLNSQRWHTALSLNLKSSLLMLFIKTISHFYSFSNTLSELTWSVSRNS